MITTKTWIWREKQRSLNINVLTFNKFEKPNMKVWILLIFFLLLSSFTGTSQKYTVFSNFKYAKRLRSSPVTFLHVLSFVLATSVELWAKNRPQLASCSHEYASCCCPCNHCVGVARIVMPHLQCWTRVPRTARSVRRSSFSRFLYQLSEVQQRTLLRIYHLWV